MGTRFSGLLLAVMTAGCATLDEVRRGGPVLGIGERELREARRSCVARAMSACTVDGAPVTVTTCLAGQVTTCEAGYRAALVEDPPAAYTAAR